MRLGTESNFSHPTWTNSISASSKRAQMRPRNERLPIQDDEDMLRSDWSVCGQCACWRPVMVPRGQRLVPTELGHEQVRGYHNTRSIPNRWYLLSNRNYLPEVMCVLDVGDLFTFGDLFISCLLSAQECVISARGNIYINFQGSLVRFTIATLYPRSVSL